jgi:xylan 1,4-beta-xylosidase
LKLLITFLIGALLAAQTPPSMPEETVTIDANAPSHPFPHFWEQMFGSGRAILSLRESYRRDLKTVKAATNFQYVRFHAIFDDETGVYDEDASGRPVYNFNYVDQIYDGLLENGVRPFVEMSFMPKKLALSDKPHAFWYKPLPNPPKDYQRWGELVYRFARHLVDRYGIDEVAQWYFEVWNEPNIDFWTGEPKESTYYQLYDSAAAAIKRVNTRLRVGGPSTAQAAWVDRFIQHCATGNIPVDFASTHVYANDKAKDVFGTDESIPRHDMVARSVEKVYKQVKSSRMPDLPIIWSEYNASYMNEPAVTDAPFMGPWLANNIRQCDGRTTLMSYWTFSDVFEEQGIVKQPFYGGFGLIAAGGIPKAAYNAFLLLHTLGTKRLETNCDACLVTQGNDGHIIFAVWNYFEPEETGAPRVFRFKAAGTSGRRIRVRIVDADHGSPLKAWNAMGKPASPTVQQLKDLRHASELPAAREQPITEPLTLQPHSLAVIEIVR